MMDWKNLIITFLVALAVNECTGITKWLARQIIRLSLHCLPRSMPKDEREIYKNGWLTHHEATQVPIVAFFDSIGVFGKSVSICASLGIEEIRVGSKQMFLKKSSSLKDILTKENYFFEIVGVIISLLSVVVSLLDSILSIVELASGKGRLIQVASFASVICMIFIATFFAKLFKKYIVKTDEFLIDVNDLDL